MSTNHNPFRRWVDSKKVKFDEMASSIGCSVASIRSYYYGMRRPSAKYMPKIAQYTNGEVTANDFYLPDQGQF